jgi:hypothetical protein
MIDGRSGGDTPDVLMLVQSTVSLRTLISMC